MECEMVSHSMTIHEKSSLHKEIHKVDHHENVVFLVILQNLKKIRECSCSCVDGILIDGLSRSIDVDTGDSVVSTALNAAATRTVETVVVGGLKYSSNIGVNN
nr:hypothetical protein [Tanacetum cinerariifolium]